MSGSSRNKTAKCAKCGTTATLFLDSDGTPTLELTQDEVRRIAQWCEQCNVVICGSCAGISPMPVGFMMIAVATCPKCKKRAVQPSIRPQRVG